MGDATTGSMIDVRDVEVIGLAGSTLVECGTAIPVARRLSDGKFCRFVVSPAPLQWFPGSEFDQLVSEGRVSPFESPVPLPSSAVAANPVQPLVLYMNQVFLAAAETTPPADWEEKQCVWTSRNFHTVSQLPADREETQCVWTLLPHESVKTWAACLPGEQAKAMLNEMAEKILDRLDAGISFTRNSEETAKLLQLADFGLCAATDKTLRWRLYLRYGATLEPDRVRRTFDSFVVREFPLCRWESYLKEMTSFQSVLISRAPDFATTTFLEVASDIRTKPEWT